MLAAVLYSLICTLVLVIWPGGVAARYVMPATMTLAVICGLMFEHLRQRLQNLLAPFTGFHALAFDRRGGIRRWGKGFVRHGKCG